MCDVSLRSLLAVNRAQKAGRAGRTRRLSHGQDTSAGHLHRQSPFVALSESFGLSLSTGCGPKGPLARLDFMAETMAMIDLVAWQKNQLFFMHPESLKSVTNQVLFFWVFRLNSPGY